MNKVTAYISENIKLMHNDIEFVRTVSVYMYAIIGLSTFLVGLYIGTRYGN